MCNLPIGLCLSRPGYLFSHQLILHNGISHVNAKYATRLIGNQWAGIIYASRGVLTRQNQNIIFLPLIAIYAYAQLPCQYVLC